MTDDRRRKTGLHLALGPVAICLALPAITSASDAVTIDINGCADISAAEATRILGVELRSIAAGKKEVSPATTHVTATCDNGRAELRADISEKDITFYQTVPLTLTTPDDNEKGSGDERLIAIAAAELVFSAWVAVAPKGTQRSEAPSVETDSTPSNGNTAPQKSPSVASRAPRDNRTGGQHHRIRVELGPLWRMYLTGTSHLLGGEVSVRVSPVTPLYLRAGLAVEGGRTERPLGRVSIFAVSGAAVLGVSATPFNRLLTGVELGGRFGFSALSGKTGNQGVVKERVKGGLGGPMVGLIVGTATNPYAILTAEVGYALYGTIGDVEKGAAVTTIDVWISTVLAAGFRF